MNRGDVVLVRFPHPSGVRGKKRPAVLPSITAALSLYAESTPPGLASVLRRIMRNSESACSNTTSVTVTGQGKFVITARARDKTGQRSDATADLTIR